MIKKHHAQILLCGKGPKIGSNSTNINTVAIELTNIIFKPRPTGNIKISGTMIKKEGVDSRMLRNQFDF